MLTSRHIKSIESTLKKQLTTTVSDILKHKNDTKHLKSAVLKVQRLMKQTNKRIYRLLPKYKFISPDVCLTVSVVISTLLQEVMWASVLKIFVEEKHLVYRIWDFIIVPMLEETARMECEKHFGTGVLFSFLMTTREAILLFRRFSELADLETRFKVDKERMMKQAKSVKTKITLIKLAGASVQVINGFIQRIFLRLSEKQDNEAISQAAWVVTVILNSLYRAIKSLKVNPVSMIEKLEAEYSNVFADKAKIKENLDKYAALFAKLMVEVFAKGKKKQVKGLTNTVNACLAKAYVLSQIKHKKTWEEIKRQVQKLRLHNQQSKKD